jgi:hypothetical protein
MRKLILSIKSVGGCGSWGRVPRSFCPEVPSLSSFVGASFFPIFRRAVHGPFLSSIFVSVPADLRLYFCAFGLEKGTFLSSWVGTRGQRYSGYSGFFCLWFELVRYIRHVIGSMPHAHVQSQGMLHHWKAGSPIKELEDPKIGLVLARPGKARLKSFLAADLVPDVHLPIEPPVPWIRLQAIPRLDRSMIRSAVCDLSLLHCGINSTPIRCGTISWSSGLPRPPLLTESESSRVPPSLL